MSEGKERTLGIVGLGEEKQMQERRDCSEEWGTGAGEDAGERGQGSWQQGLMNLGEARSW